MTMLIAPQLTGPLGQYGIKNSVLLNGSTGELQFRPKAAGDRLKNVIACRVQRIKLGTTQYIINANGGVAGCLRFDAADTMTVGHTDGASGYYCTTSAAFKDTTSFLDIVLAVDMTQVVAADRVRLWVNGVSQSWAGYSVPPQNQVQDLGNTVLHRIGAYVTGVQHAEYILADFRWLNGVAIVDPISAGLTRLDSATSNMVPRRYSGPYGVNGCNLTFDDAMDLGFDASQGNGVFSKKLSAGTAIGNTTRPDAVFDGNRYETYADTLTAPNVSGSGLITLYAGRSWGAAKTVTGFRVYATPDYGICTYGGSTLTIKLQGSTDNFSVSIIDLYAASGLANTSHIIGGGINVTTAYPYHRVVIYEDTPYGASHAITVSEIEFFEAGNFAIDGNHWSDVGGASQGTSTPTNVYASINPLSLPTTRVTITNGNRSFSAAGDIGNHRTAHCGFVIPTSGKWYWEILCGGTYSVYAEYYGIIALNKTGRLPYVPLGGGVGALSTFSYAWRPDASASYKQHDDVVASYGTAIAPGNIVGVEYDADAGTLEFFKDGVSQGVAYTGIDNTLTYTPAVSTIGSNVSTFRFEEADWTYTPTVGFKALCTKNLPATTGKNISDHFKTLLWPGNSTDGRAINTGLTECHFGWVKARNIAYQHSFCDAIRGNGSVLHTQTTDAQVASYGEYGGVAFNGTGLPTLQSGSLGPSWVNETGYNYVGWFANLPDPTIPTGGTIPLIACRSNMTLGMAIGTYVGNGLAGATLAHPGNGKAPKACMIKSTTLAQAWIVGHEAIGWNKILQLEGTYAEAALLAFNNTAPTGYLTTLGAGGYSTNTFGATYEIIWFYETNLCKIGSYVGNGSLDGPFLNTGVSPVWMLSKSSTNGVCSWAITDNVRDAVHNPINTFLYPNTNGAESVGSDEVYYMATGAKIRSTYTDPLNGIGEKYVYIMFGQPAGGYNIAPANGR